MEEFKHVYQYLATLCAGAASILSYFVWGYRKDMKRLDTIETQTQKVKDTVTHLNAQDTINKAELMLLKTQFLDSRKELREDFQELKQSIARLHQRLDNK